MGKMTDDECKKLIEKFKIKKVKKKTRIGLEECSFDCAFESSLSCQYYIFALKDGVLDQVHATFFEDENRNKGIKFYRLPKVNP